MKCSHDHEWIANSHKAWDSWIEIQTCIICLKPTTMHLYPLCPFLLLLFFIICFDSWRGQSFSWRLQAETLGQRQRHLPREFKPLLQPGTSCLFLISGQQLSPTSVLSSKWGSFCLCRTGLFLPQAIALAEHESKACPGKRFGPCSRIRWGTTEKASVMCN